jgi:hypothetical protein
MRKLFLTVAFAFVTMITSAQFIAITTLNKVEGITPAEPNTNEVYEGDVCPTTETEDSWNITDKIGVGYQVNEKLMVGITMDGEDNYELLGRYALMNGVWGTCVYNYAKDSDSELMDEMELGVGYSFKVWKGLSIDPNYTMPMKEDEEGNREGSFNLSFSYKF